MLRVTPIDPLEDPKLALAGRAVRPGGGHPKLPWPADGTPDALRNGPGACGSELSKVHPTHTGGY